MQIYNKLSIKNNRPSNNEIKLEASKIKALSNFSNKRQKFKHRQHFNIKISIKKSFNVNRIGKKLNIRSKT
jgi:hypothetical protein